MGQSAGPVIREMIAGIRIMGAVIGMGAGMVQWVLARGPKARHIWGMSTALPPRFEITRPEIERVVTAFYAAARTHPGLGPIFAAHVEDWPAHEAKVVDFWANSILHERSYSGNPVAVHVRAGNVKPGMFSTWLGLFDTILRAELPPEKAAAWSQLAHRIGRSMRASVVERETLPGGIPKLR